MATAESSNVTATRWRNLRTGLLVLAGLIIAATLGLIIGKNSSLFSRHSTATIFLAQINGMAEGNMITVSGKKIGVVKSIEFARRNDSSGVTVTLDIVSEYFPLLTSDSKVMVRSLGILGDKYLDINLGRSHVLLVEGGSLEAIVEPGFEELTASAITTMNTIEHISSRIDNGEGTIGKLITTTALYDNVMMATDHLTAITADIHDVTGTLMHGSGLIPRLINDTTWPVHVAQVLEHLRFLSASLANGKGTLGKLIMDTVLYERLNSVTMHADSLLVRFNNPASTLGKLTGEDGIYKRLDHSIMSLDSLLMDFKQNPGRYVKVSVF